MTDNAKPDPGETKFGLIKQGLGKFSIKSLDPGYDIVVHAQYNPKDLEISKEAPWQTPGDAGGGNGNTKKGGGGIEMQFTGAKGRTVNIVLTFDDTDKTRPGNIKENVKLLQELATVKNPNAKEEQMRRPHWCVAIWGTALAWQDESKFKCVITGLTTKYDLFNASGEPLRATVTLKLAEASSVSIKDKNKKDKPPAGAGGGGGGATPAGAQ